MKTEACSDSSAPKKLVLKRETLRHLKVGTGIKTGKAASLACPPPATGLCTTFYV